MKLMSKKKKEKRPITKTLKKGPEEEKPIRNNSLILGGVLLAITSIGLLVFVISEKVFQLN